MNTAYPKKLRTFPISHFMGSPKNCLAVTMTDPRTIRLGVIWQNAVKAKLSIFNDLLECLPNTFRFRNRFTSSAMMCIFNSNKFFSLSFKSIFDLKVFHHSKSSDLLPEKCGVVTWHSSLESISLTTSTFIGIKLKKQKIKIKML